MVAFLRREWLPLLLAIIPLIVTVLALPYMPDRVPIHFNMQGKADGFADKGPMLFVTPLVSVLVYVVLLKLRRFDPKKPEFSPNALAQIKTGLLLFLALLSGYMTWVQVGGETQFSAHLLTYLLLGCFLFLGNMMGKMRPSYFVGIRTPWTLESEVVWAKTHRLGGKIWVVGSLVLMTFVWALPEEALAYVFTSAVLGLFAGVPVVASWWFAQQEKKG